jgi:hypothetical protein
LAQMGMDPRVIAASAAFMIFFTASSTTLQCAPSALHGLSAASNPRGLQSARPPIRAASNPRTTNGH